jgi:hypothetical protein
VPPPGPFGWKCANFRYKREDTSCWGLGGVGDAASGVGVQALLPAGVVAVVAVKGEQFELAPTVVVALPRRRR